MNARVGIYNFERLRPDQSVLCRGKIKSLTEESTSYTRKPEFRLVSGVIDGPISRPHKHTREITKI